MDFLLIAVLTIVVGLLALIQTFRLRSIRRTDRERMSRTLIQSIRNMDPQRSER